MSNRLEQSVIFIKSYGIKYWMKTCIKKVLKTEQRKYTQLREMTKLSNDEVTKQKQTIFPFQPCISIIVPLYKTPEKFLVEMVESVVCQTYQNWELCLSDGSGEESSIKTILDKYIEKDKRIKVIYNKESLKISENTNRAMTLITGEFVAFLDHDDKLEPDALFSCVKCLNEDNEIDLIYTDEDKVSENGLVFYQPHFKSDFNKDLLLSMNYICHFVMVKRELIDIVGGLRSEFDGSQDYDFLLRCIEKTDKIKHIPRVLYHWRVHGNSIARAAEIKEYANIAGGKALEDFYFRNGIEAKVEMTKYPGIYRTRYNLTEEPKISIIIPNKDHIEDLDKCLKSIEKKSGYSNYEILIIENNSIEEDTFAFYREIESETIRVLYWPGEFNYSAINNWGVEKSTGKYLLFLNNDVELKSDGFLKEMLSIALRDDVGIVGSLLLYPDDVIQHAGVIIGYSGIAGHAFIGQPNGVPGYFSRIICMQDYSAVTAACMLVRKSTFSQVDGFDEEFKVAFNDVDFCLKVRSTGALVVYNPYAVAYHYESKSRGSDERPENRKRFESEKTLLRRKWRKYIENGDPYYNVNLTLDRPDFVIKESRRD